MLDPDTLRAMARWPDVPAVTGWLTLDGTGRWYVRGQRIKHPLILAHLKSNYDRDGSGRWFFQNGPQRVFVSLEQAPHILTWTGDPKLGFRDQCDRHQTRFDKTVLDEEGRLYLHGEHGLGYVLDQDLDTVLSWLCRADGAPEAEDALFARLETAFDSLTGDRPVTDIPLVLRLGDALLPVEGCHGSRLESRFHFQKEPRL
ncbi:DUF2946 family protein [Acanthopleuribacter pedis]|uniref:DUF2946 family protein n=1 Tax=Acanthopleuribacter pedis TaxID=442870 RepID=A0A8J7Q6I4_9BACT|nr:DUF2946 family protein [Acanthopleuribacter pedis]MBO1317614.1 DUF2946 family protein [Acanthopleuribacter pedis]